MLDATKVRVGVTGAVYVAPEGTARPTDATAALIAAFVDVGYISEDGVTESQDEDVEDITAWQNGAKVRKVKTSHDLMYSFTMIETSAVTLREYYGNFAAADSVAVGNPVDDTVEIDGVELPHRVWVLSVLDGEHVLRVVIPDGQVTERGDITYVNGEAVGREVTISCFPDANGNKAYIYMAEVAVV
ncbi:MAG: phage tail protein [Actinobacteria bacterium]|nr:phage tail protein [Actinomycetota bacterium]